ncbi:hypothetical protein CAOG_010128 [Capsaspora owczarzaki ATCC 30864]|uniref:COMM domain-containing protein n=1 Tax=Capsaspora owczarzaki (strain ATCC 30864) TaxID=595528 RepID=A0A0D2X5A2_CAPO3|nr:hypothetical protein CAOG_010128 [Capsaspora owczarzaki ATCC 30864]
MAQVWNNRLASLSWRIDVKTKSRHVENINEATSIVELKIAQLDKSTETVRFELNSDRMQFLVGQIEAIEKQLSAQASVPVVKPLIKAKPTGPSASKPTVTSKPKPALKPTPAKA